MGSHDTPRKANGQFAASGSGKKPPKAAPFRPTANPAYAAGMQQIRSSNAAGVHEDRRTRRARTRADSLRRDLNDQ
jgi:hypothetical protein